MAGTAGQFVEGATLRLHAIDGSRFGGAVYRVETPWDEASLAFGNAPALVGATVRSANLAITGAWVEFDLAGQVSGDGTFLLALISSSTDSAIYSSCEGTHPPDLWLTLR